ncbi:MAG: signal recognition particle protein [Lachnospiraceae bacterium]|nr:signal recognition particle protein [Lachnospiraceae bacterium]MDN4743175.1 signal recognition particle protein [Lachnospiraceae bacterium C1.1]
MAFESLTEKLQNVFKNLRSKGRLTEDDVKKSLKEVKMALLEADVNFKVVKQFISAIQEKAVGAEVLDNLNPAQTVIKIVNEEMISLMGSEMTELNFAPGKSITTIMMCGLNGAGKTTTTAKLAALLKKRGKKSLLVACDVYRPAAIKQLEINGEKVGAEVFKKEDSKNPVEIAKEALAYAEKNGHTVVIFDTAGRQQIDEELMDELVRIRENIEIMNTLLVVDGSTGQAAVDVAKGFDEKIGLDGVVLSKMDSDARGGAALSIRAVTGKPIIYVGMGEKLTDLEQFYPDRMASRILGMGDILSLIEKAAETVDVEAAGDMKEKFKKGKFDFDDYLTSMDQMRKMGGLSSILSMLPGLTGGKDISSMVDEKVLRRNEAIIHSMTKAERANPSILNPHRKHRIAKGAGVDIMYVNRLVKEFNEMQKMMKKMPGMMKGRGGFGGMNALKNMMRGMR